MKETTGNTRPVISKAFSLGERQEVFYRTAGAMWLANIATIPFGMMLWILAKPVVNGLVFSLLSVDTAALAAVFGQGGLQTVDANESRDRSRLFLCLYTIIMEFRYNF